MKTPGKQIAFVDYKLENFHANVYLKAFRDPLKHRGYDVAGCHATDEAGGRLWAEKNAVPYFADVAKLNDAADFFVVLAPSNPETHLGLSRLVFPFGKPTYVDKTFAPDLATAKEIFALADRHNTPVQTTSALRYTAVQRRAAEIGREKLHSMIASGGGGSFAEYAIHPVEMVVSCMGPHATAVKRQTAAESERLLIQFAGGRTAEVAFRQGDHPFAGDLTFDDPAGRPRTESVPVDLATLFTDMAAALADFFDAGRPLIDRAESLAVRRILDAADDPASRDGFVRIG